MIDSKQRSFWKAISWRLFAIVLLTVVTYTTTGDIKFTTLITLCYHSIQVLMFFIHERLWNYIKWGKTKGMFIQMTGLSGAGKTTLAREVEKRLKTKGFKVEIIDGDEYREGLCKDLGFSKEDRNTNIRRLGFVGKVLSRNNVVTIMSAINPYEELRKELEETCGAKTVFIKCPVEKCIERDVKGLYAKALSGEIQNFTGISDPFEEPNDPALIVDTTIDELEKSATVLEAFITSNI
jgi:adenylyl-sulfate kinase